MSRLTDAWRQRVERRVDPAALVCTSLSKDLISYLKKSEDLTANSLFDRNRDREYVFVVLCRLADDSREMKEKFLGSTFWRDLALVLDWDSLSGRGCGRWWCVPHLFSFSWWCVCAREEGQTSWLREKKK